MGAEPVLRRLPLRLLLDEAMRLTRRHFRTIYPSVAVVAGAGALCLGVAQSSMFRTPGEGALGELPPGLPLAAFGGGFLLFMACLWFANVAMMAAASAAAANRPVSMARCWLWVVRPAVLGTLVVVTVWVLVGSLCCALPGLVLAILLGLVIPVMVLEEVYGLKAMGRSRDLIMYNPERGLATHPGFKLFVIGFVGYLISYLSSLAVQLPFVIVQQVLLIRAIAGAEAEAAPELPAAWFVLQGLQTVLGALASEAVWLYVCVAVALLYSDLCRAKEGGDLDAALDELGAPSADSGRGSYTISSARSRPTSSPDGREDGG